MHLLYTPRARRPAVAGPVLGVVITLQAAVNSQGACIVITNRTDAPVAFSLVSLAGQAATQECKLASGDCRPYVVAGAARLRFGNGNREFAVANNCMYFVHRNGEDRLELGQIGTPGQSEHARSSIAEMVGSADKTSTRTAVVPVKVLCDDHEISISAAWEKRIRLRLEAASQLFERQCFVTFKVVAVERWQSDPDASDVGELLAEFEREVDPSPGRLAIGFSGRAMRLPPDRHLGGTRGPLRSHVMVREWAIENTEAERLELLVHELGHFLGSAHSPEINSIMRPALGDRQARAAQFRLVFDPLNTLAMCLVGQQLQLDPQVGIQSLDPGVKRELKGIYAGIHEALPDDPAALECMQQLNQPSLERSKRVRVGSQVPQ